LAGAASGMADPTNQERASTGQRCGQSQTGPIRATWFVRFRRQKKGSKSDAQYTQRVLGNTVVAGSRQEVAAETDVSRQDSGFPFKIVDIDDIVERIVDIEDIVEAIVVIDDSVEAISSRYRGSVSATSGRSCSSLGLDIRSGRGTGTKSTSISSISTTSTSICLEENRPEDWDFPAATLAYIKPDTLPDVREHARERDHIHACRSSDGVPKLRLGCRGW